VRVLNQKSYLRIRNKVLSTGFSLAFGFIGISLWLVQNKILGNGNGRKHAAHLPGAEPRIARETDKMLEAVD